MNNYNISNRDFARKLRTNQTKCESILWKYLRNKQLGYRFLRQRVIYIVREGLYTDRFIIADFYCHELKLVIEVDGSIHNLKQIKEKDKFKDKALKELGYNVLRIRNKDIMRDLDSVLENLEKHLVKKLREG